jgi:putative serine protease PepD
MTENEQQHAPGPEGQPQPAEPVTGPPAGEPVTAPQPVWPGPEQRTWYGAPTYGEQTQPSGYPPAPAPARPSRGGRLVVTGLLALLLAGGGGLVGGLVVHSVDSQGTGTAAAASSTGPTSVKVMDRSSLADIAAAVKPSVVDIRTGSGEGSGVVYSADGYIVTNNHVVASARGQTVQVEFSDGKTATAKIVGTDPKTDLAVIKVSGVSGLTAATFGDSGAVRVGDTVLAIGSPLGLEGSVTSGIVSALNRTIQEGGDEQNPTAPQTTDIAGAIQTDAAINPGNSGGALVDLNAHVIGINTAIATAGQSQGNVGVGFAIPSDLVKRVAQALISGTKVSHPFLGVQVTTADNNAGAKVAAVSGGSPAEKAGLQAGDVITRAGGKDIHTSEDLVSAVQSSKTGDKLELTVVRGGSARTVTVTIGDSS